MKARWMGAATAAGLALALSGCTNFNPAGVRARMTALVNQNKFQEARDLNVKGYAPPQNLVKKSSGELMKERLIESLVNPAEAKFTAARIRTLESQVEGALQRHDDEGARAAIYEYGVTDQHAVNMVTYLAKCAYLNSRVNPATLAKWERFAKRYVDGCIQSKDFAKATAAAKRIPSVAAYPEQIDDWMDQSGEAAIEQRAEKAGVEDLVQAKKDALYAMIAPRAGFGKGKDPLWDDLVDRVAHLEGLEVPYGGFEKGFEPDWTVVGTRLERLRQSLLQDDVSENDAAQIVWALLDGFKSLVSHDRNGLTTLELNERLKALRRDSLDAVQKAITEEMARMTAQQAAESAAEQKAKNKELEKLWNEVIGQLAASVDFLARENGFTAAISDRVEPDINRVLGEGARALRLYRANGKMTKGQATSLLLAALYMGFDDVENLAMGFGADINGTSEKDSLKRTPYLLALQYGFKGQAETLLATADIECRDAKKQGALHYAVRGNDPGQLMHLLKMRLDPGEAASDGTTPLMLAALLENGTMARMLLGNSDVNAADKDGYTALHFAARNGNLDMARTLISAGAATDRKTKAGEDILELAAAANAEDLILYLLEDVGMKVGERPVSWCVIHGKVLPLKTLVAHRGKLNDRHLAAAAKCGHLDMVKYLVGQGCDVNADAVHDVMPLLLGSSIAKYLYSQGYRSGTVHQGGQENAVQAEDATPSPEPALPGGEGIGGAVSALKGAAGRMGALKGLLPGNRE